MGVVLKRAVYFITCQGRTMYPIRLEEDYITRNLLSVKERLPYDIDGFRQMNLFDDMKLSRMPGREDYQKAVSGQL